MSTFSGLSGALSSLYAQRRGMDVTGQNIANANTDGYSRQRVDLQSVGGSAVPAMFSTSDGSSGGVTVSGVQRVLDAFLEARGRAEHAQNSYLADQNRVYTDVQQAIGALNPTGLQTQLNEFWGSWHDLANNPGGDAGGAARSQVLARAQTITDTLHATHDSLSSLFTTTRNQLDAYVQDVNSTSASIAQLNQAVIRGTQANLPVNELADQRDGLVMHLVELTGATAVARDNGSLDVLLGGSGLVSGDVSREIKLDPTAQRLDDVTATSKVTLTWTDNNAQVIVPSGQLGSSLDALNTVIPNYSGQLDNVAATLASTVNTQHTAAGKAFDLNGNPGGLFFGNPGGVNPSGVPDPTVGVTAENIALQITDPAKIAASSTSGGNFDGANADAIGLIGTASGSPDGVFQSLVTDLGVAAQRVDRRATMQDSLTKEVDASRQAQSGVNLDEEMTNLIQYQRAYQAASRVISTIDSTLDTLINHTGA